MKQAITNVKGLFKKYDFLKASKNKKSIIFLFLVLIIGIVLGTMSASSLNMEIIYKIDFLFLKDFAERINESNTQIFISSFSALSLFVLITEFLAFSCWGEFFIPFIIMFKGFSIGLSASYLYLIYNLKGIAFYLLILLPGIFISCIGLVLLSSVCMKFSFKLLKVLALKEENQILFRPILKNHFKKSIYCLLILAISSIIDVLFMMMFSKFFNF